MESVASKGMAHSGSAEAKPSEQGTRKSNGTNAAPSCQAESYVAMQHVSMSLPLDLRVPCSEGLASADPECAMPLVATDSMERPAKLCNKA